MKKANILIVLAALIITSVMVYLIFAGVKTRQQKMVSWSQVASPEQAGQKIAKFFFPILERNKSVNIELGDDFTTRFFNGFHIKAAEISPQTKVQISRPSDQFQGFSLLLKKPQAEECTKICQSGDYTGCVCLGAIKKFEKKQRDRSQYWIYMVRIEKNKSILFYKEPEN